MKAVINISVSSEEITGIRPYVTGNEETTLVVLIGGDGSEICMDERVFRRAIAVIDCEREHRQKRKAENGK